MYTTRIKLVSSNQTCKLGNIQRHAGTVPDTCMEKDTLTPDMGTLTSPRQPLAAPSPSRESTSVVLARQTEEGREPWKQLEVSAIVSKELIVNRLLGNVELKMLSLRSKLTSVMLDACQSILSRCPEMELDCRNKARRFVSLPSEEGRVPLKKLLFICNTNRAVRLPRDEGMEPERELWLTMMSNILFRLPYTSGSDPCK
jgi:hypothetical protein